MVLRRGAKSCRREGFGRRHRVREVVRWSGNAPEQWVGGRHRVRKNGAQGRNRTSDTAIFSRMLYQLSYLGPWLRPRFRDDAGRGAGR